VSLYRRSLQLKLASVTLRDVYVMKKTVNSLGKLLKKVINRGPVSLSLHYLIVTSSSLVLFTAAASLTPFRSNHLGVYLMYLFMTTGICLNLACTLWRLLRVDTTIRGKIKDMANQIAQCSVDGAAAPIVAAAGRGEHKEVEIDVPSISIHHWEHCRVLIREIDQRFVGIQLFGQQLTLIKLFGYILAVLSPAVITVAKNLWTLLSDSDYFNQ
jgi:hypothetical protein